MSSVYLRCKWYACSTVAFGYKWNIIQCHQRKYKSAVRNKPFRFLLFQYIFVEFLLYAKYYCRCLEYGTKWDRQSACLHGAWSIYMLVLNYLVERWIPKSYNTPNFSAMFCNKSQAESPFHQYICKVFDIFLVFVAVGEGQNRKCTWYKEYYLDLCQSCLFFTSVFISSWSSMAVTGDCGFLCSLELTGLLCSVQVWMLLLFLGCFVIFDPLTFLWQYHVMLKPNTKKQIYQYPNVQSREIRK